MNYPEFVRTRNALYWFCGIIASLVLINVLLLGLHALFPNQVVIESVHSDGPWKLPFMVFFPVAGLLCMALATAFGASMSRYRENAELIVTFPVTRERFALSVIGVDVAALACALAAVLIVAAAFITLHGVWPHFELFGSGAFFWLVKCFGAAVMFYALLQAVCAWVPGRGGLIMGLSWPLMFLSQAFSQITTPAWFGDIFRALRPFNPITYVSLHVDHNVIATPATLPLASQAVFPWFVALAALAVAVAGWKRQEF